MLIPYPTSQEIRYALQLKQVGMQLPTLAARYQLPTDQVLGMQCLAFEFIELIICHSLCATVSRQHRETGSVAAPTLPPELTTCKLTIQQAAQQLAVCMQHHPAYSALDDHIIGLLLPR